jgi:PqqD family protein of HPr-rel-A system
MAGPRYIADRAELVRKVELDGLTALFHVPSGMTHILAPPAPQLLDALAGSPADAEELVERLSQSFEIEGGAEAMAARLQELEAAGLVRRL